MGEMLHDPGKILSGEAVGCRVMKGRVVNDRSPLGGWQNGRLVVQDHIQIILERSQCVRSIESQKEAGTSVERKE